MSELYLNQISKNHSSSGEYSINIDIVVVRRSNRLLKRIVTIQNGFTIPLLLKHISVKMLITYSEQNHNTIEDNGYLYLDGITGIVSEMALCLH